MSQYKVLLSDRAWPDWEVEREILADADAEIIEAPDGNEETLIRLATDADAVGTCWAQITERVIEAATNCRGVSRFGIGLDNIAVATATERGIPVTNVPDYCVDEVADHTLALMLACLRNIGFFHLRTKQGEYNLQAAKPMSRLSSCTLGLVGYGRTGRAVATRARAFGMKILAHTPSGVTDDRDCRMVDFETLLRESDVISLHCPLTDESRGLFGLAEFQQMQRSACLINTSRGALIDSAALANALETGEISQAALDVFDPEPPDLSQPLYRNERVITTPHAAFLSIQSLQNLRRRAARQIADMLHGRRPEHLVNPEIWNNRA